MCATGRFDYLQGNVLPELPVFRQNVIRAESGTSPCRKRLSESRELPQGCFCLRQDSLRQQTGAVSCTHILRIEFGVRFQNDMIVSGSSIVTMMQPAESPLGQDTTRGCRTRPVIRRSLPESKIRAVVM